MTVQLSEVLPQMDAAQVDITVRVSAKLNVTQTAARRKVNGFVLDEIGTDLSGDTPTLVVQKRAAVLARSGRSSPGSARASWPGGSD